MKHSRLEKEIAQLERSYLRRRNPASGRTLTSRRVKHESDEVRYKTRVMNPPKCDNMVYINFLIAALCVFSSVEASQTHPAEERAPTHDAYTRLLQRLPPDSQGLVVYLKGYGWIKVFRTVAKLLLYNDMGKPILVQQVKKRREMRGKMTIQSLSIQLQTHGNADVVDITGQVAAAVSQAGQEAGIRNGLVTIFCPSATSALTTIEYEPGAVDDLKRLFDEILPQDRHYQHNARWGDGNGHSHVRAALLGPSLSVPFVDGELTLGTWQQIIFVDFDNRARKRSLVVQVMGE